MMHQDGYRMLIWGQLNQGFAENLSREQWAYNQWLWDAAWTCPTLSAAKRRLRKADQ